MTRVHILDDAIPGVAILTAIAPAGVTVGAMPTLTRKAPRRIRDLWKATARANVTGHCPRCLERDTHAHACPVATSDDHLAHWIDLDGLAAVTALAALEPGHRNITVLAQLRANPADGTP